MRCDSKDHSKHMCALKTHGMDDCIKELSDKPIVECKYCGAKANSFKNICAAHLADTAPSVEGGHGSVSLEDVGKPHAGEKKSDGPGRDIEAKEIGKDGFRGGY
ncbi:hypothetical protein [Geoalkalibacter halelectricus]|uniref:Uncharacterized protein n=1 Tax=Geoalkalibacter halelectricus TaxID=2847045 RepID=A0ABY5ZKA9_9BACT|nr:hypothetical protein [Geoalkalibacter halelectricus]MDO3377260.1 hypothetical protein [Geoalkalibacter halelectricus]UWZ78899.1 hypothetical protein L9S41_14595 [Geoalkalibacter halelectricus]